jgi:hypothetical protein
MKQRQSPASQGFNWAAKPQKVNTSGKMDPEVTFDTRQKGGGKKTGNLG